VTAGAATPGSGSRLARRRLAGLALLPLLPAALPPAAAVRADSPPAEIRVELETGGEAWVRRDAAIELELSAWPREEDGRLAVLLGDVDITELFARGDRGLVYRPALLALPEGEREIAVYLVTAAGEWRELARLPLRVLHPGGLEKIQPRLGFDFAARARLDEKPSRRAGPGGSPDEAASLQIGGGVSLARRGWNLEPQLQIVGVSHFSEALRFGTEGDDAPRVDLASYGVRLGRGRAALQLGNVGLEGERHLISSFQSRGLSLETPLGPRFDLALAAMNGTQIVGWDNPAGLDESRHQVLAGRIGAQVLPPRFGNLRLEASFLDGSLLPRSPYTGNAVTDAEENRGWGARIQGGTAGRKVRFEGGFAQSRFDNPADPLLAQGLHLVPVESEERRARFAELWLTPIERSTPDGRFTLLSMSLRHERVEPQYRSVAAFVQADREQNSIELQAGWRSAALQLAASEGRDNLDDLPNLLTTDTRRRAASATLPLAAMAGRPERPRLWLPSISYAFERLHQAGTGIPPNSGFAASHVPDQLSESHTAMLEWQGPLLRGGARFTASDQDNRQPGRERADFSSSTEAVFLSATIAQALDLGIDVAREELLNRELARRDETRRYGLNLLWRLPLRMTFHAIVSRQDAGDRPRTRRSENLSLYAQWAWQFERRTKRVGLFSGQLFLRYDDQSSEASDRIFGVRSDFASRTVTTGLTWSLR
jgi:hypothetical protein